LFQRFLHGAAILRNLHDQPCGGVQFLIVEYAGKALERLLAGAAVHVLARGDFKFLAQNRQGIEKFVLNHVQTLINRQADTLQQAQQVDEQRQFFGHFAAAGAATFSMNHLGLI